MGWDKLLGLGAQLSGYTNPQVATALLWLAGLSGLVSLIVGLFKVTKWARANIENPESWLCRLIVATRLRLIPLMLGTMAVAGALLIVGAILGAIAYSNTPPALTQDDITKATAALQAELNETKKKLETASASGPKSNNPLMDAIDAYLAKSGKKANYVPAGNVQMQDNTDGRGPYIARWNANLDPWPTVADGFTAGQLRMFPTKRPSFTTQFDKEKFREAVEKVSDLVRSGEQIIFKTQEFFESLGRSRWQGDTADMLHRLNEMFQIVVAVDRELLKESGIIASYPRYREELSGLIPDDSGNIWKAYEETLTSFRDAVRLLDAAKKGDPETYSFAIANMQPFERQYINGLSRIRDWVRQCNHRIDAMTRAI